MAQSVEQSTQARDASDLHFGPFRLEKTKRLWRGERIVDMRPQSLAVLRYLAERSGQLVTREELLRQLWPGIYVTKTVLRVCVHEIRQALNEDSDVQQFVETVGRQGYRFIAPIITSPPVRSLQISTPSVEAEGRVQQLRTNSLRQTTPFVGRESELALLHATFEQAQRGERQIVFLFGEAGIGKTTLVDHFLNELQANEQVRIGRGQCVEQHGGGEADLPLLEALGQLCRDPGGEQVMTILHHYAPSWLGQMFGVVETREQEALQRHVQGSSRERMLRELAGAVEAIATDAV